jgi:trigger factor
MEFAPEVLRKLSTSPWPGNVRQLRNEVMRMAACARGSVIVEEDLWAGLPMEGRDEPAPVAPVGKLQSLKNAVEELEQKMIQQALQRLLEATPLELPKSLVQMEQEELLQRAAADLQARGLKPEQMQLSPAMFEESARRRVALGLIIGELARTESLQPKPAEVRALVEQEAQSYESPAEVVKWFYMQPQRLSEMEGIALEANVVKWILSKAKVVDKAVPFDELMGANA